MKHRRSRHRFDVQKALEIVRAWGRKGGRATAKKLTPEQRRESARKAALARWSRAKKIKTTKKGW